MKVLGIETSSAQASVALLGANGWSTRRQSDEPQRHAERLMPLIQACLDEAGWTLGEVERVAVGVGPGSFTGLRVGIAFAQGVALGLAVDLVAVPSLRAMEQEAREAHPDVVLVPIVDARRNEVFLGAYDARGELFGPWAVSYEGARERVERELGGRPFIAVGSMALALFGEDCTAKVARAPSADAAWVARLALRGEGSVEALPLYARGPDAVLPNLVPNPLLSD
jgi:tRNA threonylcarbamoyladenosine biosynthesis protein TsaB